MKEFIKRIIFRIIRFCIRPFWGKGIWLISDRPWAAGDNGEAFFKFMKNKPEKAIFALQKSVPEYETLKEYGELIEYGSLKHKILLCTADVCMGSHNVHMKNHSETYQVFLQHGVCMNSLPAYMNEVHHDKFYLCVATETEVNLFISDEYAIDEQHIWLTGAPRYDYLVSEPKKRVVLALTWRYYECDKTLEDFLESNYYKRFLEIVTDEELKKDLESLGYELCYMAHPMTRKYIDQLSFDGVKALSNYNREVFKEGDLLISDYSSVVCDFAYLHKPVIFYQFDRKEFFDCEWVKPEFDYDQNGFGPVATTYEELKNQIIAYVNNQCKMEAKYQERIDDFIKYHDRGNCQRVYEKIKAIL